MTPLRFPKLTSGQAAAEELGSRARQSPVGALPVLRETAVREGFSPAAT